MPATVRMTIDPSQSRRRVLWLASALAALGLLTACGSGSTTAQPVVTVTQTVGSGAGDGGSTATAQPSPTGSALAQSGIAAVTTAGALVVLNPVTGSITRTLVSGGVLGDEIAVSPSGGTVYFAQGHGCHPIIRSVGINGGPTTAVVQGELPAISPDGSKLAFAQEPSLTVGCVPNEADLTKSYRLVIRTLQTGADKVFPMPPAVQRSGLPAPISHLSWASDDVRLAVSISAVEDNEGWELAIVDTSTQSITCFPAPEFPRFRSPAHPTLSAAISGKASSCRTATCSSAAPAAVACPSTIRPG